MRILKVINNELIDIREFRNANATFNTNEYRKSDDICIYHEQLNPFDLYSDYIKQKHEIDRLNNIINGIEAYCNMAITMNFNMNNSKLQEQIVEDYTNVLNKLKELKDSD